MHISPRSASGCLDFFLDDTPDPRAPLTLTTPETGSDVIAPGETVPADEILAVIPVDRAPPYFEIPLPEISHTVDVPREADVTRALRLHAEAQRAHQARPHKVGIARVAFRRKADQQRTGAKYTGVA